MNRVLQSNTEGPTWWVVFVTTTAWWDNQDFSVRLFQHMKKGMFLNLTLQIKRKPILNKLNKNKTT